MSIQIDTGGVVAIKGFNYQHAVSILILLLHHGKNNFSIIPEGLDDIQVFDNEVSYFLQIKGKRITPGALIIPAKKQTESIVEKLLNKKSDYKLENKYKIVCTESNCTLQVNKVKSDLFYSPYKPDINYSYFFDEEPIRKLAYFKKVTSEKKLELISMVNKSKCYITPFKNENSSYQPYLRGTIRNLGIDLSPESEINALLTMKDYITSRSQIKVVNEKQAKDKAIKTEDIRYLFEGGKKQKKLKELINELINDYCGNNTGLKYKIKSIVLGIIDNLEIDAHYLKIKEMLISNEDKLKEFIYKTADYIDYSLDLLEEILDKYEKKLGSNYETLSRVIVYYCIKIEGGYDNDNK